MSVLLSYSVVKEPTSAKRVARLGAPHVRVKQNVSTFGERILPDAELPARWKDLRSTAGTTERRELRILLAAARRVNCAGTVVTAPPTPLFPRPAAAIIQRTSRCLDSPTTPRRPFLFRACPAQLAVQIGLTHQLIKDRVPR